MPKHRYQFGNRVIVSFDQTQSKEVLNAFRHHYNGVVEYLGTDDLSITPLTVSDPNTHIGVWAAYCHDRSAVRVFETEIEALRYAVDNHEGVKFLEFGKELMEEN